MRLIYDEISPITGNKCVVVEYDELHNETKLCMESGYYFTENLDIDEFELTVPQMIVDEKFIDPEGCVWYKIIIMTPTMILYPDVNGKWLIASLVICGENEPALFVWGDEGKVVDTTSIVTFEEFTDAFDNFNLIQTLHA